MNLFLAFAERLVGYVRLEFEQVVARLNAWAAIEHAPDGTHTGASGTFTTADAKTVTVVNGLITSIT